MAQIYSYKCPQCGANVFSNQKFCAKCGLPTTSNMPPLQREPFVEDQDLLPSYSPAPSQRSGYPAVQSRDAISPPIMPGPDATPISSPGDQWVVSPSIQSSPSVYTPLPQRNRPDRRRVVLIVMLVLIVLLLGTAGYLGLRSIGAGSMAQSTIVTTNMNNATLTYAGVNMLLLDAQQAQNFTDDPNTHTDGMVRIHLQAQNQGKVPVNLNYNMIAHLLLPGGKVVEPVYVNENSTVVPGATQKSMIDFATSSNTKIDQFSFRLGAADEAQVDVALNGHADLAQYAAKAVTPNKKLQYLGLGWLLTNAQLQMGVDGMQASKGMRYVNITLKVDSALSQIAIAGPATSYAHLKVNNATIAPQTSTLPVSFEAGATGKTGMVTFLVPQDATTFTLVLASQNPDGFDQATADFQF